MKRSPKNASRNIQHANRQGSPREASASKTICTDEKMIVGIIHGYDFSVTLTSVKKDVSISSDNEDADIDDTSPYLLVNHLKEMHDSDVSSSTDSSRNPPQLHQPESSSDSCMTSEPEQ